MIRPYSMHIVLIFNGITNSCGAREGQGDGPVVVNYCGGRGRGAVGRG